jgi:hypothetical protein
MDAPRFDDLSRTLAGSRRSLVGGALAALAGVLAAADADARKKRKKKRRKGGCRPNCADRACGSDGCGGSCGGCGATQVCHGGACCLPESRGAACAGRCGTRTNNCGQPVACATCAGGRVCLGNGSCAIACTDNNDCDACGGGACPDATNVEGERHCTGGLVQPITTCTGTVDCPPGSHCTDMGGGGVCEELCA